MSPFDLIKKLYLKTALKYDEINNLEVKDSIMMIHFLTQDPNNLEVLKRAIGYLFNVSPACFYIYLYCKIPKQNICPFLKLPKKVETDDDELFKKMKYVMGWSDREMKENKAFIEKLVSFDREHFMERLGVEPKKTKEKK